MKKSFDYFFKVIKRWWKKHIADNCPPDLDDHEFSEKYR